MIFRKTKAGGRYLQDGAETGDRPSSWHVCFASGDGDASVENVIQAGAMPLPDPFDDPGAGRTAVVQDPRHVDFGA